MAVRPSPVERSSRRSWLVAASLVVLFIAALFLRAYWNMDAAEQDGGFILAAGSDPYYHKRAIDHIQDNGYTTLIHDPMLNYPYGAVNPNPPLYEWSVAVAGHLMAPFFDATPTMSAEQVATWHAFLWSSVIFGALTLIPIYFIGKSLFNRRAGLIAALFWTISTSSIDTTGLGSADHDAAVMFFATLAFLFYIKAIEQFRGDGHWVRRWSDSSTVGSGLSRFFRERRVGLMYALLSGVAIASVALTWKGFPYVLGIMFAYAGIQMIVDHWRSRDSTGVFIGTFIAMLVGTLLALPYYQATGLTNFLRPVWFLVAGFGIAGLVLVPTRDLPTILVMPAAALVAALGAIVAFFVAPDIANSLLYATVYFKQTALYETIAEAHPADFSMLVFSIGPIPYFLAIFGFFILAFNLKKYPGRAGLFAVVWGVLALYMAMSAVRFVFNAIPILVVFAGFGLAWVLDWLDFAAIRKSLAANQGNFWQGLRKGTRTLHVIAAILIVLFLVVPSTMLAADAAIPPAKEQSIAEGSDSEFVKNLMQKRFGAYGQGFIPDYWHSALTWLDGHNANITAPEDRPGFLAWWDYGHWAIAVGRTPAVADNFQNGYVFAASFLLSQNETHAIQLLSARQIDLLTDARADAILAAHGVTDPAAARQSLERFEYTPLMDKQQAVAVLADVEAETGKAIRYFAVDIRMLPYDNPQTPGFIEQSSIFYAPVRLAGGEPDDYVTHTINVGNRWVTQDQYRDLARDPIRPVYPQGERFEYQERFFNTMYWRAYVGDEVQGPFPVTGEVVATAQPRPGEGLEHFRLIYQNDGVKLLEYFPGAVVTGTVTEEGTPLAGVTLTAYDDAGEMILAGFPEQTRASLDTEDFNLAHASTTTAADGSFRLLAPFAMPGGHVTLVARGADGTEVGRTLLAITREDAQSGATFQADITVRLGHVEGIAFEDADNDGIFDEDERPAANVVVTVAGRSATTDAEGRYRIDGISAGRQSVTTDSDQFDVREQQGFVTVRPDETTTHNVPLVLRQATMTGVAWYDLDNDGARGEAEGVDLVTLEFTPDETVEGNTAVATNATTSFGGAYQIALAPGTYVVSGTITEGDTTYTLEQTLVLAPGEDTELDFEFVGQ